MTEAAERDGGVVCSCSKGCKSRAEMEARHGTSAAYREAVERAIGDISPREATVAIDRYTREYEAAAAAEAVSPLPSAEQAAMALLDAARDFTDRFRAAALRGHEAFGHVNEVYDALERAVDGTDRALRDSAFRARPRHLRRPKDDPQPGLGLCGLASWGEETVERFADVTCPVCVAAHAVVASRDMRRKSVGHAHSGVSADAPAEPPRTSGPQSPAFDNGDDDAPPLPLDPAPRTVNGPMQCEIRDVQITVGNPAANEHTRAAVEALANAARANADAIAECARALKGGNHSLGTGISLSGPTEARES